jgi:hypothetical protein
MGGSKRLLHTSKARPTGIEKNVLKKYERRDIKIKKNLGKGHQAAIAMPQNTVFLKNSAMEWMS